MFGYTFSPLRQIRFLKNELGGRANKPTKSSPKTNKHKSSPNQRHGHAISKLEAELDLDFTAISQDIKKSVEYVMKKHMHNYPSPQRTTGAAGAVEGFAPTAGAQPTPITPVVESPRKEDVVSVPVPASSETASAAATKKSKHKKGKTKDGSASETSSSAPVPAMARESSFTKNVMNSLGGLFRANSTSSNPASSSSTAASVTKNVAAAAPAPRGAAPRNARPAQRPPRSALNAISDTEEDGYVDNTNNDDQTDDNSVSAMLREREQWERDITQAEIVFDTTARNLAALTDAKVLLSIQCALSS